MGDEIVRRGGTVEEARRRRGLAPHGGDGHGVERGRSGAKGNDRGEQWQRKRGARLESGAKAGGALRGEGRREARRPRERHTAAAGERETAIGREKMVVRDS
jgi:hypothetical protein